MTYVMSDIHGEYEKYMKMLELIEFDEDDDLYILGDIVDRGPQPISVMQDMMKRCNVFPLMGNHDLFAYDILSRLSVDITDENLTTQIDSAVMEELLDWYKEGGEPTMKQFQQLSKEERGDLLDYMSDFPLCDYLEIEDKAFILVHAGLGNFRVDKKLRDYTAEELIMSRNDPDKRLFDDETMYVVTGHTPTPVFTGKSEIYISANNICIDCGVVFGGRLACLCLETMEEFYV